MNEYTKDEGGHTNEVKNKSRTQRVSAKSIHDININRSLTTLLQPVSENHEIIIRNYVLSMKFILL